MTIDDKDERETGTAAAPGDTATATPPDTGQGAIRGAFLARTARNAVAGEGGQGERADATLRGAYITQIAREQRRREVVVGTEDLGGSVLRSVYAAQSIVTSVPGAAPACRARAAAKKAAPAKRKAAPAKKKAPPAKKRRAAKAAAPKARAQKRRPAATAARRKVAKKAATPVRRKKAGRRRARR
jgi:hypothetical protein